MFKIINKLISSSVSMAFLVVLSWSAAYSYGWAQSYFYGYPWWYVDIGIGNVARSLGYVILVTLILIAGYLLGILILRKLKPLVSRASIELIRTYILCSIFSLSILIVNFLLMGKVNHYFIIGYLAFSIIFTILFKGYIRKHIRNIDVGALLRFLYEHKNYVMIFTYSYFVIFAFIVGYFRPCFKTSFDMLEIQNNMYYVLAKYDETFILSSNTDIDDGNFYLYKLNPNQLSHVKMTKIIPGK